MGTDPCDGLAGAACGFPERRSGECGGADANRRARLRGRRGSRHVHQASDLLQRTRTSSSNLQCLVACENCFPEGGRFPSIPQACQGEARQARPELQLSWPCCRLLCIALYLFYVSCRSHPGRGAFSLRQSQDEGHNGEDSHEPDSVCSVLAGSAACGFLRAGLRADARRRPRPRRRGPSRRTSPLAGPARQRRRTTAPMPRSQAQLRTARIPRSRRPTTFPRTAM